MERLSSLAEVSEPDVRWKDMVLRHADGSSEPYTLAMWYSVIETTQLHTKVPHDVQDTFQVARSALLYAWYAYPLTVAAMLQAYASLEYALRESLRLPERLTKKGRERPYYLGELLEVAIDRGMLTDKGFRNCVDVAESGISFTRRIREYLPDLRNSLAHGTYLLDPFFAVYVLRLIADAIDQLFPRTVA